MRRVKTWPEVGRVGVAGVGRAGAGEGRGKCREDWPPANLMGRDGWKERQTDSG